MKSLLDSWTSNEEAERQRAQQDKWESDARLKSWEEAERASERIHEDVLAESKAEEDAFQASREAEARRLQRQEANEAAFQAAIQMSLNDGTSRHTSKHHAEPSVLQVTWMRTVDLTKARRERRPPANSRHVRRQQLRPLRQRLRSTSVYEILRKSKA